MENVIEKTKQKKGANEEQKTATITDLTVVSTGQICTGINQDKCWYTVVFYKTTIT